MEAAMLVMLLVICISVVSFVAIDYWLLTICPFVAAGILYLLFLVVSLPFYSTIAINSG